MKKNIYGSILLVSFMISCIHNDIPYPYILSEIQELEVEGQIGETKIDQTKRIAQLTIDELAELDKLKITKLIANKEATITPEHNASLNAKMFPSFSFTSLNELPANANTVINFTNPVKILLQSYQDYWWTVTVKQVINRTVSIENQVGNPVIDELNRIALVYVSPSQSLKNIKINELNLEGVNTKLLPTASTVTDFSRPQQFTVFRHYKHREDKYIGIWTLDIVHTEATSSTGNVEVWGKKAIVSGGVKAGTTPTVEYKKSTESEWTQLNASAITTITSTSFSGTIKGLDDGTLYQWRILADGVASNSALFTTEKIQVIPNMNFDTWTLNGKNWFASDVATNYYTNPRAYWSTGNEGITSTIAGNKDPITIPVEGADAYRGKAARLRSITGVFLVGAAAGNLFTGKYKTNTDRPSASVEFGRPFTGARPTRLTGYYKYTPEPISNGGTIPGNLIKDQGHIYIKLSDSSGSEFAYGELVCSEKVDEYTKFSIDINYKDLSARPATMTIVATSSRYGGEFEKAKVVGQVGHGSTLYVDEFELSYD